MNAFLDNGYTQAWQRIGQRTTTPKAILSISAHWFVPETGVTVGTAPRTIHDFGGFPRELYRVQYPAPGDPDLARRVQQLLEPIAVALDNSWGLDHGTWSVLRHAYPAADIPVVQLSIDETQPADFHFEIGRKIAPLRDEGVPSQRVMGLVNHSYAELLTAASNVLTPMPAGLDEKQAAALPLVTTTGAQLIERIGPRPNDTILVTGAFGNVGRSAVYAAKQRGARVIAGVLAAQRDDARSLGADQVVATDSDDEIASLPALNAIADTVGGQLIGKLIPKLAPGGTLGSVLGKPKAAEGRNIRVEAVQSHPDASLLSKLAEAVGRGALVVPVAREFSLRDAGEAQKLSERGSINGKIVLVP